MLVLVLLLVPAFPALVRELVQVLFPMLWLVVMGVVYFLAPRMPWMIFQMYWEYVLCLGKLRLAARGQTDYGETMV